MIYSEWLLVSDWLVRVFLKLLTCWDVSNQGLFKGKKIYSELQFSGLKCHVGVRGQMRKVKLLEADSKATVIQIITCRIISPNTQHVNP